MSQPPKLTSLAQYSFHSNTEGFAADNIHSFEIVLGDGSIVNANADENADLWKALKGGSGNFGFVTKLEECEFKDHAMVIFPRLTPSRHCP